MAYEEWQTRKPSPAQGYQREEWEDALVKKWGENVEKLVRKVHIDIIPYLWYFQSDFDRNEGHRFRKTVIQDINDLVTTANQGGFGNFRTDIPEKDKTRFIVDYLLPFLEEEWIRGGALRNSSQDRGEESDEDTEIERHDEASTFIEEFMDDYSKDPAMAWDKLDDVAKKKTAAPLTARETLRLTMAPPPVPVRHDKRPSGRARWKKKEDQYAALGPEYALWQNEGGMTPVEKERRAKYRAERKAAHQRKGLSGKQVTDAKARAEWPPVRRQRKPFQQSKAEFKAAQAAYAAKGPLYAKRLRESEARKARRRQKPGPPKRGQRKKKADAEKKKKDEEDKGKK